MTIKPSDLSSKIDIPAGITPINDASQYPTHYANFGFGGLRTVDSISERNSIPLLMQEVGMIVYVEDDTKYFRLVTKTATLSNTDWVEISLDANIQSIRIEFNSQTTGSSPDWEETSMGSGIFRLTLNHGFGSNELEFSFFTLTNCPHLVCATSITTTVLTIEVPLANVFSGVAYLTRVL